MEESRTSRPRIVLADDHTLVAEGLFKLLEEEFDLVGYAENGRELIQVVLDKRPDLVLLDISMPEMNGFEAMRKLLDVYPKLHFIFITMHADPVYAQEAFRAGASGYLLKRSAASEMVKAIRTVLEGEQYVAPSMAALLAETQTTADALTPRQRQVLRLVAEGASAKEVATTLDISVKTAEFHKSCIMQKLNLRTTAQLTRYAMEHGIVRQ